MNDIRFAKPTEQSDWKCEVAGLTYIPKKGDEPNGFWRLMQYLILGARWTKRP